MNSGRFILHSRCNYPFVISSVMVLSLSHSCVKYVVQVPYVLQVPHVEVLECVSLILKDHGFCFIGDGVDIGNLY